MSSTSRSSKFALALTLFFFAIVVFFLPRLMPEISLSRRTLLWVPVLHQILVASLLSASIWSATGRRKSVVIACAIVVVLIFGPNFAGAIEYSFTGRNENVYAVSEMLGVTHVLNTLYPFLYDAIGYSLSIRTA